LLPFINEERDTYRDGDIPTKSTIMQAMSKWPDGPDTSEEEKAAVKYFIRRVLPCANANASKSSLKKIDGNTHLNLCGSTFVYDLALAMLLLTEYSDPTQLLANVEITRQINIDGSRKEDLKPVRQWLHDTRKRKEIPSIYYRYCWEFRKLLEPKEENQPSLFKKKFEAWDEYSIADCQKQQRGAESRINTVPLDKQSTSEDPDYYPDFGIVFGTDNNDALEADLRAAGCPPLGDPRADPDSQQFGGRLEACEDL